VRGGTRLVAAIGLGAISARAAEPASVYEQVIGPIFRARCVECHGEQKQKAKLALHSWEALAKGSDAGAALVAGKPGDSALVQRMKLPVADEEHMPPGDKPQPAPEEIELLARWIAHGASKTATVADLKLPEPLAKAAAQLPAKLGAIASAAAQAEPLWEFDPAAVTKARAPLAAKVAELQRRFPGALSYESRTSPALLFTAVGFGRDFGDTELAALAPLRDQLASLDLSGTAVTDQSAAVVGGFTKLRVFRAGATTVGDATVEKLAGIATLESISLPGTAVTAASVGPLSRLRALRALRVAGTAAERPAQVANLPVGPSAADSIPPVSAEPEKPTAK
jgi:hypothetical protein